MVFVGLSMVMIVLYSSGKVGLALKSYLLAPRSEPATSVENFVLRHSGLERERDVERHSSLSALGFSHSG